MTLTAAERSAILARVGGRVERAETGLSVVEFAERIRSAGHDPAVMLAGAPTHRLERVASGEILRDGLCRTVPFAQERAEGEENSDGLNIEGYGAVFDSTTEIHSWEGSFLEKIRKGAFRKTLREQTPKMQFDHGHHPLLGGLPLGKWNETKEDDQGVFAQGRLFDNWITQPFRDAIAEGAVDGMSFRFSVVREEWRDAQGKKISDDHELFELLYFGVEGDERLPLTRELIEVKAPEMGPVVWPAYKDTSVSARSADGGTLTIDLGALRSNPRILADVAALVDAEALRHEQRAILDSAERRIAAIDSTGDQEIVHNQPVHTPSPEGERTEPPATERPAEAHPDPASAPRHTGTSAGEHSPSDQPRRPANPTERRESMRATYRDYLDRVLALPDS